MRVRVPGGHLACVGIGCERIEQAGVNRHAVVFDLRFQPVGRHLGFRPDKTKRFHGCCIEVEKRRHIRVGAKREPLNAAMVGGIALIVAGVALLESSGRKKEDAS